jgi:hypothetical protein
MKILIYNNNEIINQKIQIALNAFENCQVILSKDYHTFKKEFSFCLCGETIIVFFISDESDIGFLESMQKKFVDIKLIINISEKKTYQRALKLQPRVITNADENTELLLGVIQGCVKEKLKNQFE